MSGWLIFGIVAFFIVCGLLVTAIAAFGLFKFRYALNRMHAAAMADTLGIMLILSGLIFATGLRFESLKLALIIILLWCAGPVSSHLLAGFEVATSSKFRENCASDTDEGKDGKEE